jgi:hypothetical protein
MVIINGVKTETVSDYELSQKAQKKPSINEILDKMQNNYDSINGAQNVSTSAQSLGENNTAQDVSAMGGIFGASDDKNNLLMSLLPLIISGKGKNSASFIQSQQQQLVKQLIKSANNPLLEKFFELLPKFKQNAKTSETVETKKEEPKIDSFVKTDEYNCDK